jgi:AraC family transcriptional regulator of arabinose operon
MQGDKARKDYAMPNFMAMDEILKYLSDFMKRKHEGFPHQQLTRVPLEILKKCRSTPLIKDLFVTDIGYFPASAGHLVDRPNGCETNIMIFCLAGAGWISLSGKRKIPVRQGGLVFIPAGCAHRYGASEETPWQIRWVHFSGQRSSVYLDRLKGEFFGEVLPEENDKIVSAFEQAQEVLGEGYTDSGLLLLSASLSRLLALAIQSKQAHGEKPRLTGLRILNSIQWVREHLAEPLVLPEIARRAGLSVPHFCALFKKQTGMSPMRYLMHARMTRACALLDSTDKSVAEISSEVGFRDAFHFTKTFRAVVGSSPSNYRSDSGEHCS